MNDFDFYRALAALPNMPAELRAELGRRQLAAHRATWGGVFTFARTERRNAYRIGDRTIETDAAGMQALSLAVLNPGRDIQLSAQRDRKAWRAAIERALASTVEPIAPDLARALSPPDGRHAPGLRLRVDDGRVVARWTCAPNVRVTVS